MRKHTTAFTTFFLLLLMFPLSVLAQKTVFVVESYHAEYAWDASYIKALQETLGPRYKLEFFEMDTKRLPKDKHQKMSDLAWKKYLELKPDLVVLGDDAALIHLVKRLAETRTPVVYLGINNNPRDYVPPSAENFTGVLERPLLKRSIAFLQALIPAAKRILILFDDDVTAQVIKKEVFSGRDSTVINGITVEIRLIGTLKEYKEAVLSAKGQYDATVIGLYQSVKTPEGAAVDAEELISWVSRNSTVPPFAFWDFAVGAHRTAGGLVLYGREMGTLAAGLVKNILEDGTPPRNIIPVLNNQGVFLFSKSQLKNWKLTLPKEILSSATLVD